MKYIFKLIWWMMGWEIIGDVPRHEKKYIIIVAPHTSNKDFFIGILVRGILGFNSKYLGKKSLFKAPYGWFFRMTGGYPVDRSKSVNLVDQVVEIYRNHNSFVLALAPEGTRKNVDDWKTGFYYIALRAKVPITLGYLDYKEKKLGVGYFFLPSGDIEKDMKIVRAFYEGKIGRHPEQQGEIAILPKE